MSLLKRIEQNQSGDSSSHGGLGDRRFQDLKNRVQNRLLAELDPEMDLSNTDEVRRIIEELFDKILAEEGIVL